MKTIFITGASSGLGKASAKLFQSKGWNVIATMRKPEKETELVKLANVTILKLDVTDPEEIQETVNKAIENYPVDVVLNNAGYGLVGILEAFSDDQKSVQKRNIKKYRKCLCIDWFLTDCTDFHR